MLQKFEQDDGLLRPLQELFPSSSADENEKEDTIVLLTEAYHNYKRKYVKHLTFDPKEKNLSKDLPFYQLVLNKLLVSATLLEHVPLKAVYIYFDTATYDEIKRDEKVLFWGSISFLEGTVCL